MTADVWHYHQPGRPSDWAVLDVGLFCPHSCRHCFYVGMNDPEREHGTHWGMRHAKFHSTEWLLRLVRSIAANGFIGFDITGGEPTAHPGLVDVIAEATRLGLATRIITLGQFLPKKDFALMNRLLAAGVTDFIFSTHAADEALFHELTGESLAASEACKTYLDNIGFSYTINATISNKNFKTLPDMALMFAGHSGCHLVNLLCFMPLYEWAGDHGAEVEANFMEALPYLTEAVAILDAKGIAVNIRYAPMCQVRGLEKHMVGIVGVRYDPHEWNNRIDHYATDEADPDEIGRRIDIIPGEPPGAGLYLFDQPGEIGGVPDIMGFRGPSSASASKLFPTKCTGCAAMGTCDGVSPGYLARHGAEDMQPYPGPDLGGLLHHDRLTYELAWKIKIRQEPHIGKPIEISTVECSRGWQPSASLGKYSAVAARHPNGDISFISNMVVTLHEDGRKTVSQKDASHD